MEAVLVLFVVAIWFGVAFICARIAAEKGRSAGAFFLLGLVLGVIALIICVVMQPTQFSQGSVVKFATEVHLDDGTTLQRGWLTTVNEVSVIDNTRVVSVTDPQGQQRWVAAKAVRLSG